MPAARLMRGQVFCLIAMLCSQTVLFADTVPPKAGFLTFLKNSSPIALVLLALFIGTWITLLVIFFPALIKRIFRTLTTRTTLILIGLVAAACIAYRVMGRERAESLIGAGSIDFIQGNWPAITIVTLFLLLLCGGRPVRFLLRLFLE